MNAVVTLTFLSAKEGVIRSGDRAGSSYYRAHFLTEDEEPQSFAVTAELFASLKNDCSFGDVLECSLSIRSTPSGVYTQLVGYKK